MNKIELSCLAALVAYGLMCFLTINPDHLDAYLIGAVVVLVLVAIAYALSSFWIGQKFPSAEQELDRANKEFNRRPRLAGGLFKGLVK